MKEGQTPKINHLGCSHTLGFAYFERIKRFEEIGYLLVISGGKYSKSSVGVHDFPTWAKHTYLWTWRAHGSPPRGALLGSTTCWHIAPAEHLSQFLIVAQPSTLRLTLSQPFQQRTHFHSRITYVSENAVPGEGQTFHFSSRSTKHRCSGRMYKVTPEMHPFLPANCYLILQHIRACTLSALENTNSKSDPG
ncbi:hypothetical protein N431DRAFT_122490 [Stipitochalara longipes BDJ]|nr:hypothetical protein N431DRAFT_122490 [Stipitochalara longipes BDJ]